MSTFPNFVHYLITSNYGRKLYLFDERGGLYMNTLLELYTHTHEFYSRPQSN